ncbi:ComF family protein [Pseudomonas sp. RP23018S]|uniref:ComF family protein n=1 Tax=Pseudomonas sp. RP23018S TaxID=3096037 RepID=UPI002ACABD0C|nr:ComF family protein [Pseudomonas sp. RP23018S]MDZ5604109.1 ComF family protein [Pseudomonas sp. RP23018S]
MNCQLTLKILVDKWLNSNHICQLCLNPALQHYPLCHGCETELPWLINACSHCALPLPGPGLTCTRCTYAPAPFDAVIAPWQYRFPIDTLVSRFKHRRQWPLGRLMVDALAQALTHRYGDGLPRPDLLLPVPMARRRLRQRGFNQAGLLGRWLSQQLQVPYSERWLLRSRDTAAQQTLDARARQRNLRNAFTLAPCAAPAGRHLALIDDVFTTGATAQALAALLRAAGAVRVDVYCLARTPRPAPA